PRRYFRQQARRRQRACLSGEAVHPRRLTTKNQIAQERNTMLNMNRRRFVQTAAATAIGAALPLIHTRGASAADPLKIGFLYVGPVNDGGWNTAHEAARQEMMKTLGD